MDGVIFETPHPDQMVFGGWSLVSTGFSSRYANMH